MTDTDAASIERMGTLARLRKSLVSAAERADLALDGQSRTYIVVVVLLVYAVTVALTAIFLVFRGGDEAGQQLLDLIKVAVIPIITLVIGYYFGSKKA